VFRFIILCFSVIALTISFSVLFPSVVLGLFFSILAKRLAGKNVSKILCQVGRKTLSLSINPVFLKDFLLGNTTPDVIYILKVCFKCVVR